MVANRHPDMIDEWLVGQDMAYGSTITMTDNVYMTNEAWTQADSYIMKGYRKLPIVKENPDWDIIEFLDIFKAHKACYQANKVCTDDKCSPIKEKYQSSQANHGYDQKSSRGDKRKASTNPTTIRQVIKFSNKKISLNH